MALKRGSKVNANFSMSSMTDIVFLLLIFFMVSSTLIHPNALKLLLPQSNSQTSAKPFTTISITEDIKYYVEQDQVSIAQMEAILRERMQGQDEPTVSLHVHRSVPMDEVVKVMNIAKDNRYRLILATQPLR